MLNAHKDNRFKNQDEKVKPEVWQSAPSSVLGFDDKTRAKALGFESGIEMYRQLSSAQFVGYVDKPFLVLASDDDEISIPSQIPTVDILNNPHGLLLETKYGGHCHFFSQVKDHPEIKERRFYPDILLNYFDSLSHYNQVHSRAQSQQK
mmetsp:Transcript_14719/g.25042  ORF Transcript_14719/g.25042 Transcript_14719/m.25042 type:complete len:149 (-) Transcript_14719:36-482(-)